MPVVHPAWSRQATLYEVNVRQYTREGTFAAFERHLPRLADMGASLLWLMPIHPIGVLHRKGRLGSYYAVRDHLAVNPEFGTLEDLRRLVRRAHGLGLRVLLDWVANHTAWDHVWVEAHPEWYRRDGQGRLEALAFDNGREVESWSDVIGLDYAQPSLWPAMTAALEHWVREADVDGYRCDVAGLVPLPFWVQARAALERLKPVFLLAEWDDPALHEEAFDASYDWPLHEALAAIAAGAADADALRDWLAQQARLPADACRLLFTSNHDKNSWVGSDAERFGPAFEACAVLAATLPGLPLVYGGQEAGLDRRLAFFEKDAIDWRDLPLRGFYERLMRLKREHPALANGAEGGAAVELAIPGAEAARTFAFERRRGDDWVRVEANLSPRPSAALGLPAWGYRIEAAAPAASASRSRP